MLFCRTIWIDRSDVLPDHVVLELSGVPSGVGSRRESSPSVVAETRHLIQGITLAGDAEAGDSVRRVRLGEDDARGQGSDQCRVEIR